MNSWKVILATVVIFGAGVMTGGLLVNYVQSAHSRTSRHPETRPFGGNAALQTNSQGQTAARSPAPRPPEILNRQFLQRLDEELHLKPEQHEAIQKIISDDQNQMRKVVQDARLEIREVLTPEQQGQFDDLVKRPFRKPLFGTNSPAQLPSATNAPPATP